MAQQVSGKSFEFLLNAAGIPLPTYGTNSNETAKRVRISLQTLYEYYMENGEGPYSSLNAVPAKIKFSTYGTLLEIWDTDELVYVEIPESILLYNLPLPWYDSAVWYDGEPWVDG